ncbi:MAG: metallophosphoesterase [Anaerolineales bacterium]|nr:metallophosphoesterase [Anaerolineales bacterium]
MSNNGKRAFFREPLRFLFSHLVRATSHFINFVIPDDFIPLSSIEITPLPLTLPRLDPAFNGYKIVHISDFHMGTWMNRARLTHIVRLINAQTPDVILITGDLVSYEVEAPLQDMTPALRELHAPDGIFTVFGNHDYYSGEQEKIRTWLKTIPIIELRNDIHPLQRGKATLTLAGVDDCYDGADDLDQVIARVSNGHGRTPTILLAHEPDLADLTAQTGLFDLQLSGHSHGGQVVFPRLGMLYLPRLGRKYPRGLYQINGMTLYTNRGLGTSHLRVRYNCPPEIAVFTLQVKS